MSENHRNPLPTIDIIIELTGGGVVLIERKNIPHGWALPGGFVDYGESLEAAAVREAKEETSLAVQLIEQFYTYSDPSRDPRRAVETRRERARCEKQRGGEGDEPPLRHAGARRRRRGRVRADR